MQDIAYKVLTAEEFSALQTGRFAGAPADLVDGYIHLSTAAQLTETVDKHFAGRTDLVIVAVDLKNFGKEMRWEVSRNNALFPHLYGQLVPTCITASGRLERNQDGTVKLPTAS